MGYTALYREWRPKTFDDVVGQEHITTTLKNEIINDRIAHAYLFCGTRGTGKTSTAKVMAKALNCLNLQDGEPCNECEMCKKINEGLAIDVTELDAASNNGIDKIRDINFLLFIFTLLSTFYVFCTHFYFIYFSYRFSRN